MAEKQFNNPLPILELTEFFGKNGDEFGKFNAGFLGAHNMMHVQDHKSGTTFGGAFTTGAWRTRDLNTIIINNINGASLSTNIITLPAGKYYIEAEAPAAYIYIHKIRVYDLTANAALFYGTTQRSDLTYPGMTPSKGAKTVDLLVQSNISLQHSAYGSHADGFGIGYNEGGVNIYSDLKIWKIA